MGKGQVTMSLIESYASDESFQYISLIRQVDEEDESCRDAALELVAATSALCGDWISPLAVSLRVEVRNPEDFYFVDEKHPPARPAWFLRLREWDKRLSLSPDWIAPEERRADAIGSAELLAFVEEALDQRPAAMPREVALPELTVNALAITLPEGVELEPRYMGMPVHPVLKRDGQRSRALGPKNGVAGGMPARLRASNSNGLSRLGISLCWDFWSVHPAGRAQVRAALDRVLGRGQGWQLEEGELS
jgi:hypothetical protein